MKKIKFILLAVIVASLFSFNNVSAQVTTEFSDIKITQADYQDISGKAGVMVIAEDKLVEIPIDSKKKDLDDGYVRIPIGFDFDFNGETYTHLFINVNGFVTFGRIENGQVSEPPYLTERLRNPKEAFFQDDNSFPVNVIAPFWGDHYYRDAQAAFNDYVESEISYINESYDINNHQVLTIQWKNLNINYDLDGEKIKSSVANFQVKIYESDKNFSKQGDIAFCYGQIGGNDKVKDTRVITKGAVVGLKGYKQAQGTGADYLNGLSYDVDRTTKNVIMDASVNLEMSNAWTPSGATNNRIYFVSFGKSKEADWWGDGDVDFSKVAGGRHYAYNDGKISSQNRWVTANDVRVIMNAIATDTPLEPTIERAAYHGDVNHNGRYFFNSKGKKQNIPWKSDFYNDDLDNDITKEISNPKQQIYFEVTAFDAATILNFMAARITQLPWLLDMEAKGKVIASDLADGIQLGAVKVLSNSLIQVPVYLNGTFEGPVAFNFNVNGTVEQVIKNPDYNTVTANSENKVVVATTGLFNDHTPICYVNVRTNNNQIELTNVVYNDNNIADVIATSVETQDANEFMSVTPNPVQNSATISMNIANAGIYNVALFDLTGRKVLDVYSGQLSVGNNPVDLDVTSLNHGVYFIKAEGSNTVKTYKVVVK